MALTKTYFLYVYFFDFERKSNGPNGMVSFNAPLWLETLINVLISFEYQPMLI